jgi:hypothetical protein
MHAGRNANWPEFVAELAAEAEQLAADLVGVPEDLLAEILDELRDGARATLGSSLGKKRATIVAKAFTRLIVRRRGELVAMGFIGNRGTLQ